MTLRLLEHPLSSYAQKIKIALREKALKFTAETPEGFGAARPAGELARVNPRGEVPVLLDGDVVLFESTIIFEYIEDRWPQPALLPADPALRARARTTEEVCDTQYEAINWGWGEILWFRRAEGDLAEQMKSAARRQTQVMQAWLADRLGDAPWFGGEHFGWADVAVAPLLNRSIHYGLGPAAGSPLHAWRERIGARPSVSQTFAEFDAAAARMAAAPISIERAVGGANTATTAWTGCCVRADGPWSKRECATAISGFPGPTEFGP